MYLTENLNILSKSFPDIYKRIRSIEGLDNSKTIKPETARNGMPTIIYESDSGSVYLHSKYDPVTEAERFIDQYKDVDRYKHVFFYGLGMGYHIEEFCRKWPDKKYTIYEAEQSILLSFMKERQLKLFPLTNCRGIYTGSSQADIELILQQYVNQINGEVLFITLPSYERIFGSSYKNFLEIFRTTVMNKKATLNVETHFQKLWTTNSLRNFKEVINSSNILQDKKRYFSGKPAIIAAAGPSLGDELENLRLIKEKGLAYIFSVGSAINTLISNGIFPHAACVYDPGLNTGEVIRKVKEQGLNIPLIYGSSVYSGAIQDYPGCKLHILTSQDTVSAYYLKDKDGNELQKIIDAPSIAIIVLQMLVLLGCTPIILVGQNFAYKNNRYYAQGIGYKGRSGELCNADLNNAFEVEDVHGGGVYTDNSFSQMRRDMEEYIRRFNVNNVINCTDGGARIEGTTYRPLTELVNEIMSESTIDEDWMIEQDNRYDFSYMKVQNDILLLEHDRLSKIIDSIFPIINRLESLFEKGSDKAILTTLSSFDKEINKILKNKFFDVFLRPMDRRQLDIINRNLDDIYSERNMKARAQKVVEHFKPFINACYRDLVDVTQLFYENDDYISDNDIKVLSFTVKVVHNC